MPRHLVPLLAALAASGCKNDEAPRREPPPAPRVVGGVYPDKWRCDSAAPPADLARVLGGAVTPVASGAVVPTGVPQPCTYELAGPPAEQWMFDIDCRDGMKQRADVLFAQYQASSQAAVDEARRLEAAAPRRGDAGAGPAPEPAVEVAVGARGLDHHGGGVLFIDDDAPCYVRVVGRDATRRLALARLVAEHLTFANAPMTPRAAR